MGWERFRLNFGGKDIWTMEELQERFTIEDALGYYHDKKLVRWLKDLGCDDEAEQVEAIQATDVLGILGELMRILGVSSDPAKVEAGLSLEDYIKRRGKSWEEFKEKKQNDELQIIEAYTDGYDALVDDILEHPKDLHYIYDRLDELAEKYPKLLEVGAYHLFCYFFREEAPLASFALFANSRTRFYCTIRNGWDDDDGYGSPPSNCVCLLENQDPIWGWTPSSVSRPQWRVNPMMRKDIPGAGDSFFLLQTTYMLNTFAAFDMPELRAILGDYMQERIVTGDIEIEPSGKKYMILRAFPSRALSLSSNYYDEGWRPVPDERIIMCGFPLLDGIRAHKIGYFDGHKSFSWEGDVTIYYMEGR